LGGVGKEGKALIQDSTVFSILIAVFSVETVMIQKT